MISVWNISNYIKIKLDVTLFKCIYFRCFQYQYMEYRKTCEYIVSQYPINYVSRLTRSPDGNIDEMLLSCFTQYTWDMVLRSQEKKKRFWLIHWPKFWLNYFYHIKGPHYPHFLNSIQSVFRSWKKRNIMVKIIIGATCYTNYFLDCSCSLYSQLFKGCDICKLSI